MSTIRINYDCIIYDPAVIARVFERENRKRVEESRRKGLSRIGWFVMELAMLTYEYQYAARLQPGLTRSEWLARRGK